MFVNAALTDMKWFWNEGMSENMHMSCGGYVSIISLSGGGHDRSIIIMGINVYGDRTATPILDFGMLLVRFQGKDAWSGWLVGLTICLLAQDDLSQRPWNVAGCGEACLQWVQGNSWDSRFAMQFPMQIRKEKKSSMRNSHHFCHFGGAYSGAGCHVQRECRCTHEIHIPWLVCWWRSGTL